MQRFFLQKAKWSNLNFEMVLATRIGLREKLKSRWPVRNSGIRQEGGGGWRWGYCRHAVGKSQGGKERKLFLQPGPDSQRAEELGVLKMHKDPTNH